MVRRRIMRARARLHRSMSRMLAPRSLRPQWVPDVEGGSSSPPDPRQVLIQAWRKTRQSAPALFMREVLSNPRFMGAACPSSQQLAASMAALLPHRFDGHVVELGAGTGVITAALLKRGVRPHQLMVVERSPLLAAHLRRRFPQITVIQGDAADLASIISDYQVRVGAAISSLPLRSLKPETVRAIMSQIDRVLGPNGLFIQYTYALGALPSTLPRRFKPVRSRIIWRNLPPARVDMFRISLS